jgi:ubiquinone/menaquinone biosynthesis C-methylase UbiE
MCPAETSLPLEESEAEMDLKDSVTRQFGAVAANYAASFTHSQGPDLDRLVERAKALAPKTMLDAGCGTGHTALALAASGIRMTALDLTPEMLEQGRGLAKERALEISFDLGDVEALPYPDASFDAVSSRLAAHHFPNPRRAVSEFMRVLRPGGTFLLSDVVSYEEPLADTFLQAMELLRDPSHVRDHRVDEWVEMISTAGGRAELVDTWPLVQAFDSWIERMQTPAPEEAVLRRMFEAAPAEARAALGLGEGTERGFTLTVALIEAQRPA